MEHGPPLIGVEGLKICGQIRVIVHSVSIAISGNSEQLTANRDKIEVFYEKLY